MEKIKCKVTSVDLTKFDGQEYSTISFRLNTPIKKMVENDNGLYEEGTSSFISMPISAFMASINNDTINYYFATKGVDIETLQNAFGAATLEIGQVKVEAKKTYKDFKNEKDRDVYFNEIISTTPSRLAIVKIAVELGVDPNYLID